MKTRALSTKLSFLITAAIIGASALPCSAASVAADRDEARQVVVRFDDLNLSNPRGAAALYRRIAVAAHEVCDAPGLSSRDPGYRASVDACVQKAISGAVTTVGRTELFAIYNARNSKPLGMPVADAQSR